MFLKENQVRYLTSQFMPRLKGDSINAIIDVTCHGFSILASSQKYKLTHQSLSKNLINLKKLQGKIVNSEGLLPSSYLLKENTHALLMAKMSFLEAKILLLSMCEKLGGTVEFGEENKEVKMYLNDTMTAIYLNPKNESYEREWSYDHSDLK